MARAQQHPRSKHSWIFVHFFRLTFTVHSFQSPVPFVPAPVPTCIPATSPLSRPNRCPQTPPTSPRFTGEHSPPIAQFQTRRSSSNFLFHLPPLDSSFFSHLRSVFLHLVPDKNDNYRKLESDSYVYMNCCNFLFMNMNWWRCCSLV